jgi:hypothetical protein
LRGTWTQNRFGEQALGGRVGAGGLADVFDRPAEDVFALEASYRLDFDERRPGATLRRA